MPVSGLRTSHTLTHLILTRGFYWGYHDPHFRGKQTEASGHSGTFPRNIAKVKVRLTPRQPSSRVCILSCPTTLLPPLHSILLSVLHRLDTSQMFVSKRNAQHKKHPKFRKDIKNCSFCQCLVVTVLSKYLLCEWVSYSESISSISLLVKTMTSEIYCHWSFYEEF